MGEVIGAGELHKGVKLLIDGEPWEITEFDFSKPGKGQAIYNCKLRNMMTGGGMTKSYRSGDKFEKPDLTQQDVTYSYDDGQAFVFTDSNFEEIRVSYDVMGDKKFFLMDEMEVKALFFNDKAIAYHLSDLGICISTGSACASGSLDPSHVIRAMGVPFIAVHGSVRFSLSRYNTMEEVDYVLEKLPPVIQNLRELSPFGPNADPTTYQ